MLFKKKRYFILSGGGAKGIAHIAYLEKDHKNIDALIGTSSGALAAVLYSFYGGDLKRIHSILKEIFNLKIISDIENYYENIKEKSFLNFTTRFFSEMKLLRGKSLFSIQELEEFLKDIFKDAELSSLDIPVYPTAINLSKGKYTIFKNTKIVTALLSSMAIPLIFSPIYLDDDIFLDGGYLVNVPVSFAYYLGADETYLCDVSGDYFRPDNDIKGVSLVLNLLNVNQTYINNMERYLASYVKILRFKNIHWYSFSKMSQIYEQATESCKSGIYDSKNKLKKKELRILKGSRWEIR